ncbi:SDR family oxidoreductase [Brevibacillus parabrevis]|uniref:SDR family oxidoreductase n=1 Tax=Brevibacillus parabrevis TaxID=54914 RepID=UPI002E1A59FC|nr:SDR family NAD(P)-dependent oxidoreductase [Brevibacillus parabrevis]
MSASKLVVITGATRGLGRAMVERFHEAGWVVAGCGRSMAEVWNLNREFGKRHHFSMIDVSDGKRVESWAEEVCSKLGVPDLLLNNASLINRNSLLMELSPEEFTTVMNVNVNGVFYVCRAFLPKMVPNPEGRVIVNISSYWGRVGEAYVAPYCASKFAVEGLTQSLAQELPKGMAAVALDPGGSVGTSMLQACSPQDMAAAPSAQEWSRVAVPYIMSLSAKDNGKSLTCPPVR